MPETLSRWFCRKSEQKKPNPELSPVDEAIRRHIRDWWQHLPPEISLITPPDYRQELGVQTFGNDCENFVLGKNGIMNALLKCEKIVGEPQKDDIVLYVLTGKYEKSVRHIGKYDEDGYVVSKWGESGPVLRHPVRSVPTSYGDSVFFVRVSKERIKEFQKLPSPDYI